MSRFSLSSPFTLFHPLLPKDQDITLGSISNCSVINNCSRSLSLSPTVSSNSTSTISDTQQQQELLHKQQEHAFKFYDATAIGLSDKIEQTKQISKHLVALQREIKEEEDEIFADINSLINDRSNLYSTSFDAESDVDFEENGVFSGNTIVSPLRVVSAQNQHEALSSSSPKLKSSLFHQQSEQRPITPSSPKTTVDSLAHQHEGRESAEFDCQQSNNNRIRGQEQLDEDEDQQQILTEQDLQEELQLQQQRDIKELTNNLPKPCVFFLEGNCRRSDCKFSHDLSTITCKYWIEGFCFKGELCPFSHSLASLNGGYDYDPSLIDDENGFGRKQLDPTFAIESEADFPSLHLDAPTNDMNSLLEDEILMKNSRHGLQTKTTKNQILSSNPTVVFKTSKKKRKKSIKLYEELKQKKNENRCKNNNSKEKQNVIAH